MKAAAASNLPFSDAELDAAVESLRQLVPSDASSAVDWDGLRDLYARRAHLKHKDWSETCKSAEQLATILGGPDDPTFRA